MKMKFTYRGLFAQLFAAAAILSAISCTKDATSQPGGAPEIPAGQYLCFEAGTPETISENGAQDTRAGYDGSLGHAAWDQGDVIGVFCDNNSNVRFTQKPGTLSANRRTVDFEGTLPNPVTGNQTFFAIYPYDPLATRNYSLFSMYFPGHQVYKPGGYTGIPLFGKYVGDVANLKFSGFKNPFSVFELRLASEEPIKVKRIVVKGNYYEMLAGAITVDLSGERPSVSFDKYEDSEIVVLDCGDGVTLGKDPTSFYIAVAKCNFFYGVQFNIRLDREGANAIVLNSKPDSFGGEANTIYRSPVRTNSTADCIYSIPDRNFRNLLAGDGAVTVLDEKTGEVTINRTNFSAMPQSKSISSLDGIEYFTDKTSLICRNNMIASLDLSRNTKLTTLVCDQNRLTKLDLSKNTSLTEVNCFNNRLVELNLPKSGTLKWLYCYNNQLTKLDVTPYKLMHTFVCHTNYLTKLDVSQNTSLSTLGCSNNRLTQLDATKMSFTTYQEFVLGCGSQTNSVGGGVTLQLKLRNDQQPWWTSNLQNKSTNTNVSVTYVN